MQNIDFLGGFVGIFLIIGFILCKIIEIWQKKRQ